MSSAGRSSFSSASSLTRELAGGGEDVGDALPGQLVGALVARVAGVTLDPVPADLVRCHRGDEALPQVDVLDRLLGRGLPAVALPSGQPPGDPVEHVLAVGVELDRDRSAERLEGGDRGQQLHSVVRGRPIAAVQLLHHGAVSQPHSPATRTRVATACPVGVDHGLVHAAQAIPSRAPLRRSAPPREQEVASGKRTIPIPSRLMTTWGSPAQAPDRTRPNRDRGAELVLVSGKVRTPAHPSGFVQAAAINGGVVVALGRDEEIRGHVRPFTRVVNLRGRLAIPAFGDAHVHPVQGGLESRRCNLAGLRTRRQYLDTIAAYCDALPLGAWVLGGGWSMPAFPGGKPSAADLDMVTGGRPAFLPNRDHHSAWVNTAALEIAGVTADTPDPADGRIERDQAGVPTGALHDGAMRLVADYVPPPSQAELSAALLAAQARLHSLGITSIQDACIGDAGELGMPDAFDTYRRAAADRLLTCRVTGALWWDRFRGRHQLDTLQGRREAADGGGYFRATSVKLMLDGVCETFTAAMGTPYLDGHGHHTDRSGNLFIEPEELAEAVGLLADLGFQLHFHAIGDRAVTAALDTLATIPDGLRAGGRHHIAHLQFVRPSDLQRFAELGVIANFQPLWACRDEQNDQLTVPFVGDERAAWQYRIGSVPALRGAGGVGRG